jgi:hypothetical protein
MCVGEALDTRANGGTHALVDFGEIPGHQ